MKALLSLLAALAGIAASAAPPNLLWIIAEDFGPHLGCYGTKEVFSPNLDALAAAGTRYTRCFTAAPVCSPSRSAFMTGMYQTTIGAHQHRTPNKKPLPDGVRLLPHRLADAGYFTANLRKFPAELGIKGSGKTDLNFTFEGPAFAGDDWEELKSRQPFYAQINFQETHRKFQAPRRADPAKVEVPPYYPEHPVIRADWAAYLDSASELDRKAGLVLERLAKDGLADNTIVVFFGDNGQAHVRGKQFCYDSGLLVPLIIRWPAALRPPADWKPGAVSDRLLCAIDLTAQTLAWAGLPKPAAMQGRVFLGPGAEPARDIVFGARDRCDMTVFRFRTARDAQYRYIRNFTPDRPFLLHNRYKAESYPAWNLIKELGAQGKLETPAQRLLAASTLPEEELYDTAADPHETVNLAASADPAHRAALERLRGATLRWIEESGDMGRNDDTSVRDDDPAEPAPKKNHKKK